MFYDYDLLNRRGGKFGIIWLVANKKLKYNGRGSKNDLRLLLKVDIVRTCQEILRYLKLEIPPKVQGESVPRLSLYLSGLLAHGTGVACFRQTVYDLSHLVLAIQKKKKEATSKQSNVTCDDLDLSNAQIEETENLLNDHANLADREFGVLSDVVEALRISPKTYREKDTNPKTQLGLATLDKIGNDFMELADVFNSVLQDPNGHFASECDITLKDIDPVVEVSQNQEFGMAESNMNMIASLSDMGNVQDLINQTAALDLMDIDVPENNSKRPHDNAQEGECVPSKQSRLTSPNKELLTFPAVEVPPTDIQLEPLENYLVQRRPRRPRLLIDKETCITLEAFKAQREQFGGTLRVESSLHDIIPSPRYAACTALDLLRRTSVSVRSPFLKELMTKRMVTSATNESSFDYISPEMINPHQGMAPLDMVNNPMEIDESRIRPLFNTSELIDGLTSAGVIGELPSGNDPIIPSDEISHRRLPDDSGVDIETLRPGLSRDASYTGSLAGNSTSRIDVSVHERSIVTCLNPQPEKPSILETVREVSIEVSQRSSRLTSNSAPLIDPTSRLAQLLVRVETPNQTPTAKPSSIEVSRDVPIPIGSSHLNPTPLEDQPTTPLRRLKVPDPQELLDFVISTMQELARPLTFRTLVPPSLHTIIEASKILEGLLKLHKQKKIYLHQEPCNMLPYEDIFIDLIRPADQTQTN